MFEARLFIYKTVCVFFFLMYQMYSITNFWLKRLFEFNDTETYKVKVNHLPLSSSQSLLLGSTKFSNLVHIILDFSNQTPKA